MNKSISLKTFLFVFVVFTYMFLSLFGLLRTSHISQAGHMTHDCPYMVGEQGLCPMNLFDHIMAWQQFSEAVFLPMNILLSLIALVGFHLYFSSSPPLSYIRLRRRKFTEPLYQSLFSDGILNSKAF